MNSTAELAAEGESVLSVRFDYSLDTSDFFTRFPQAKAVLQEVANGIVSRLGDDLTAITPPPRSEITWAPQVIGPSTGVITALPQNFSVAANELVVFVGGRPLPGDEQGVGGALTFAAGQTCTTNSCLDVARAYFDNLQSRGEPGALTSPPTDFAPSVSFLSLDTLEDDWFFGAAGNAPSGQFDFRSLVNHELAHALGFGFAGSWNNYVVNGTFNGPRARSEYVGGGAVPVTQDKLHWAASVAAQTQTTMTAAYNGQLSRLDFAALEDIGWEVLPAPVPTVQLSTTSATVEESSGEISVVATLSAAAETGITVPYTLTGTAVAGSDYSVSPIGALTFSVGEDRATIKIDPLEDLLFEADEEIVVTLGTPTGAILGATTRQTITITDTTTPPVVSVSVSPAIVAEDGSANLVYTFTQTGAAPLTVDYTVSGTATTGTDYTGTSSSIVIPATGSATVIVDPTPDTNNTEGNETVILTIDTSAAYTISATAGFATGTITNNVMPQPATITYAAPNDSPDPRPLSKGELPSLWVGQRSSARRFVIDLASPLSATPTASDIVLTNLGVNADADTDIPIASSAYTVTVSNGNQRLTIDVPRTTDANGIYQTLPDGVYQLQISAAATGSTPLTITGSEANKFFVLRGDFDGDGAVSNSDSRSIAYFFLVEADMGTPVTPSQFVDLRTPVGINNQDFVLFRQSFNNFLTFPGQSASRGEAEQLSTLSTANDSADVNGDGILTAGDALNVINALNQGLVAEGEAGSLRMDPNDDGQLTAADALYVINRLAVDAVQLHSATAEDDETDEAVDELLADKGFVEGLF